VLKAFVISITALTARAELRRRRARRCFTSMSTLLLRCTTIRSAASLGSVLRDPRQHGCRRSNAFVLRFMEDMELTEVASALDVSLSTTKRRLARVWKRISILVQRDPALAHYLSSIKRSSHRPVMTSPRARRPTSFAPGQLGQGRDWR